MEISVLSMIASAVLVLVCIYLIISPFFRNEMNIFHQTSELSAHENKTALLTTLNEIEFEHKMQKISDDDYKSLKQHYETLLGNIYKQEEKVIQKEVQHEVLKEIEAEIEEELRKRQEARGRK